MFWFLEWVFLVVECLEFVWVVVGVSCFDVGGIGFVLVGCWSTVVM